MAIVKKATINGRTVKRDCASLCPNRLRGYWADVDGNKIDKITFGSTMRFYIETYWAYNAKIKIYIKSNVSIILNNPEEKIVEDTIDKLIPGYFAMKKNFVEIKLKKSSDYKVLHGMKDFELFCDITEGFNNFYGYENIAKIKIQAIAPWMDIAIQELGVTEIEGKEHNPRVIEYHAATSGQFKTDEVPWCSSFVNWCLLQVGISGTNSALAYSWKTYGKIIDKPAYGAIVVMNYSHVGFVAGINYDGRIVLLGGNQADSVNLSPNPASLVVTYRYPVGYEPEYKIPKYNLKKRSLDVSTTR